VCVFDVVCDLVGGMVAIKVLVGWGEGLSVAGNEETHACPGREVRRGGEERKVEFLKKAKTMQEGRS